MKSLFIILIAVLSPFGAAVAGTAPWLEQAKLVASDGAASDRFGNSVALEGDTAVVGVSRADIVDGEDKNGDPIILEDQGAVYVLVRDGETWTEQAKLTASDGASNDWFGSSVALEGDTILVGASQEVAGGSGAAYIFVHDGGDWVQQAKLAASDGAAGYQFGTSVALFGDTALVGAERAEVDGNVLGAAYVFTRDGGGTWSEEQKLVPDWTFGSCGGGTNCPRFGNSVTLWEDTALVGTVHMFVDGTFRAGAAHVFVREIGDWTQQAMLRRPMVASGERFGESVALWGDTAVVGAPGVTVDGNAGQGTVHVFTRDGGTWIGQQEFTAFDGESGDNFGTSVVLFNDMALIGAPFSGLQGAVYRYTRDGQTWSERQKLEPCGGAAADDFGHSVALSGIAVLVGSPKADIAGNNNQGAAYVFAEALGLDLIFDPVGLDFGDVEAGTTSDPQTATLSNTGGAVACGLTFNTPGNGFNVDTSGCGDNLVAGGDCEVSVVFAPAATGPAGATLTAEGDQGASADLALAGEGTGFLSFSPAGLDFGDVVVGATAEPQAATLSNTGDIDATGLTFNMLGGGFDVDTTDCGAILPAGGDCEVSVIFTPPATGPAGATLNADSDQGGSANLTLTGEGMDKLSFFPASLDFGDVEVGMTSPPQTATLSNNGDTDAPGLTFNTPGGGFDVDSSGCGAALPASGDCEVSVTFTPVVPGQADDMLIVEGDDDVSAGLSLTGNGTGGPGPGILSVQPGKLNFGTIEAGDTAVMTATVANTADPGAGALTLDVLDLDGSGVLDPSTSLVSLRPGGGQQWNNHSPFSVTTPDGRYVAYISFVPGNRPVPFRHDLWTGEIQAVSVRSNPDDGWATVLDNDGFLDISADGRYVAFFYTGAGIPPIPDGPDGYYVRDMDAGVTEFIDIPTVDGEPPDGSMWEFSFSADFRIMAFSSRASNLVSGVELPGVSTGPWRNVYVHDRDAGTVELLTVTFDNDGMGGDENSRNVVITPDGRYVAFHSGATNLVPDDTNGKGDIFVHDRVTGITERVSVASDGSEGNANVMTSGLPAISADGRYVAFWSIASNLVPNDTNGMADTFVRDRVAGTTERVSVASDGSQALGGGTANNITPDGRYVVFNSIAPNLVPGDFNEQVDTFVHDRATGITERVSVATDGTEGNGHSYGGRPGISADGRFVTFASNASNLVFDANGHVDIFVRDRGGPAPLAAFAVTGGDCAAGTVLESGESCTVEITFSPPFSGGDFEGTLMVGTDDEQSASVMLRGVSPQGPVLAFNPLSLDFGEVPVGTASAPRSATLTNTGDGDATGLVFTASGGGDFFDADATDCGNNLPAGESCQVVVAFTPPGIGLTFAALNAESDEGASAGLNLAGKGGPGDVDVEVIFRDRFQVNDE